MPRLHCFWFTAACFMYMAVGLKYPAACLMTSCVFCKSLCLAKFNSWQLEFQGSFHAVQVDLFFLHVFKYLQGRCWCMSRPGFTATVKCCCCIHLFRVGCGPSSRPACFRFQCAMANTRMSKWAAILVAARRFECSQCVRLAFPSI